MKNTARIGLGLLLGCAPAGVGMASAPPVHPLVACLPLSLPGPATLQAWFMAHLEDPHPRFGEIQALAQQTGLSCRQVIAWFWHARAHDWQRYRALAQTHGEGLSDSDTASDDDLSDSDTASDVEMT